MTYQKLLLHIGASHNSHPLSLIGITDGFELFPVTDITVACSQTL